MKSIKWSRTKPGSYRAEYAGHAYGITQLVSGRWEITGGIPADWTREHYTLRAAKDHVDYMLITRPGMTRSAC